MTSQSWPVSCSERPIEVQQITPVELCLYTCLRHSYEVEYASCPLHARWIMWHLQAHIPCGPLTKPALSCVSLNSRPGSIWHNAPRAASVTLHPMISLCRLCSLLLRLRLLLLLWCRLLRSGLLRLFFSIFLKHQVQLYEHNPGSVWKSLTDCTVKAHQC